MAAVWRCPSCGVPNPRPGTCAACGSSLSAPPPAATQSRRALLPQGTSPQPPPPAQQGTPFADPPAPAVAAGLPATRQSSSLSRATQRVLVVGGLAGTVAGPPLERRRPIGRTLKWVLAAGVIACIPLVIQAGIRFLMPVFIILLILAFFTKGKVGMGGFFGVIGRVFIGVLHIPFLLFGRGPGQEHYPVIAFRVRTDDGALVECELPGDVHGGSLQHGDRVRVYGRRQAFTRIVRARRVVNENSHAITFGHVPVKATVSRWLGWLLLVGSACAGIYYLITRMG